MSKWTRWEPDEDAKYPDNVEIGEESGFRIATVWNTPRQDAEKNAALILAAPNLLAACERLLNECPFECSTDRCECGENGNGFDDKGNPCEHIQARRAIAKAKGQ